MAKKQRQYHHLLSIDGSPGCLWAQEFGSYNHDEVWDEYLEMRDRGWKRSELKIVTTGDTHEDLMLVLRDLNKEP